MSFATIGRFPGVLLERKPSWLRVRFDDDCTMLGFPLVGGVRTTGRTVLWHEVRNGELPLDVDPARLVTDRLTAMGEPLAPTFLTSRSLAHVHARTEQSGAARATAIATVGLGNALRVGDSPGTCQMVGTINVLCHASAPLTEAAMLEAFAVAVEARTVAIHGTAIASRRSGGIATGTGTDCVIIAAPMHAEAEPYAGKHTALGHVIGLAVREAVTEGALRWKETTGWS